MITSYSISNAGTTGIELSSETTPVPYNPQNMLVLFAVVNDLLVVPAAIGFLRMKNDLLKMPLLVSLAASSSRLAFPDMALLVANRLTVLSGIFLSIFAGYGILNIAKGLKPRLPVALAGPILAAFAMIGLAYATMPYDDPFILYGATRADIEEFVPVTMQFNSINIQDNEKKMSNIEWINQNTRRDTVVVGEKHWRGFLELYLEDERTYRYSSDPQALADTLERCGENTFLLRFEGSSLTTLTVVEDAAIR
jgi:hypothetical protein